LSFRLGNQLFFIRIEDQVERLDVPGSRAGVLSISEGCGGHPCIMPMRFHAGAWTPVVAGWGLVDMRTGNAIDPVALISDELIEMTSWEVQDFAIQIVREHLEKDGKSLMSWQNNPGVDPSIWFVGDSGPEWVIVRPATYPTRTADPPANWQQIAERCAPLGKVGYFASVAIATAEEAADPGSTAPPKLLWRGHAVDAQFEGLLAHR
jgi:hypothetical protein